MRGKRRQVTLVLFHPSKDVWIHSIHSSLDVEVENHETDQKGRLIILRAKIDECRLIFINVYAPNDQKLNAVRIF